MINRTTPARPAKSTNQRRDSNCTRRGYSLFREDNGRPVARLRPTGDDDRVEVVWWSHRGKWEQIGCLGPLVMPVSEALDYIARDPCGCFWH